MQTIKDKVKEFSVSHPNCTSFLQNFVQHKEEEINKGKNDYEKGTMLEKAKALCEYDVASFRKSVLPGFEYKLELLNNNDPDYELI